MLTNEQMNHIADVSRTGDELQRFMTEGGFSVLKKHILDPMCQGAFETFTKVDPSEPLQVIQAQQIWKVVKEIERLITSKIEQGRLAKNTLLELPVDEGE